MAAVPLLFNKYKEKRAKAIVVIAYKIARTLSITFSKIIENETC